MEEKMEFTQYTCPVCDKRFENGDDVVVCPECGAPHHRECFENNGKCFYEDRHAPGFSFENADKADGDNDESESDSPDLVICPKCKASNEKTSFYCGTCGYPLNSEDRTNQQYSQANNGRNSAQGTPFGFGSAGNPAFDPLVGLDSEEEIADNVKVGEAAKFIGKSTPYYLMVFNRIKKFGSGKFNFSAFLFSGAYFIYRKMYVPGIIMMLVMIGTNLGTTAITMANYNWMNELGYTDMFNGVYRGGFNSDQMTAIFLTAGLNILRYAVMVLSGIFANKIYYKHCTKRINQIKNESTESELNKNLETKGGVNLPMAISFFAAYFVIYQLSGLYLMFQS